MCSARFSLRFIMNIPASRAPASAISSSVGRDCVHPPPISLHQLDLLSLHQQQSGVYQEVIRGNQRSSEAISLHQQQSEVYQGQSHAFMRAMCMSA